MSIWSPNCENALNKQINMEYNASYIYHYLFSVFNHQNVALDNIATFFNKCSLEEREHAHKLIEYQNKRGGEVKLTFIDGISQSLPNDNSRVLKAFEMALNLEQKVYESLLSLHKISDSANDPQFSDYIEGDFLEEQVNAIDELRRYITQIKNIGEDYHGLWHFNNTFSI